MRKIGLDVHRDFCEVAIVEAGRVRRAGRVATEPAALTLFAQSLGADDEVVLEATANALAIARLIEPHVGRVVLANPKAVKAATGLRAKTDKIDAATLAKLLAGGFLPEVWTPDEQTRVRRRLIARRGQLVRHRTREKNQVHAILQRNLAPRQPMSDLFGVKGREWLAEQVERLPRDEQTMARACLRQIDFLDAEVARGGRRPPRAAPRQLQRHGAGGASTSSSAWSRGWVLSRPARRSRSPLALRASRLPTTANSSRVGHPGPHTEDRTDPDRRERHPQRLGDLGPVKRSLRKATIASTRSSGVRLATRAGAEERSSKPRLPSAR